MKKWIFPLVLIFIELVFIILFLTPSIVAVLPQFFIWIRDFFDVALTFISKLLHLPTFVENGEINSFIANGISLFIINFVILVIYFTIYFIKSKRSKKNEIIKNEEVTPKSEFDPVLFEKRVPVLRLVFIWLPLNLWILYFFVLNSADLQTNFKKSMPELYNVFANNIEFYNANAKPLFEKDNAVKFAILVIGLLVVAFVYWMIFSILAEMLKTPIAKAKANRALKEHEKRLQTIQEEENVNDEVSVFERTKSPHSKSIAETIATIDIGTINEKDRTNRQNYFDDLAHGIVDLGVEEKKLYEVAKPNVTRKPLRVIYTALDQTQGSTVQEIQNLQEENEKQLPNVKEKAKDQNELILDNKFDVLNDNKAEIVKEDNVEVKANESKEQKEIERVKPLTPQNLRKPVKVIPVNPRPRPLKDYVGEDVSVAEVVKND